MASALKPGQLAPESGIYTVTGNRNRRHREVVIPKGKPLPPARRGERYRLRESAKRQ